MIMEMTTSAFLFLPVSPSRATSQGANQIASQIENSVRYLQGSWSLGSKRTEAFNELFSVADECKNSNWDAQGAAPVSKQTYSLAYRLIEILPPNALDFTVGAEPDGHLTLEWHQSPRQTLSVSISPERELHYAALMGRRSRYGTELFFGEVPKVILDLISEVKTTQIEHACHS
jgi:hypothetical protein